MRKRWRPSRRALLVLIAGLAVALAAETAVLAATVKLNGGAVRAVRTATADSDVSTTSTSLADVPGMSTTVSVPSGEKAILVITFTAESRCIGSSTTLCIVRVLVDSSAAKPGDIAFDSAFDGNTFSAPEANSMQFVAGPLSAGSHTVKVQYRVDEASSGFDLRARTLTVLRSKV